MKESDCKLFEITSLLQKRKTDFRSLSVARLLISRLSPGSVLDVGCGSGHFMHAMRKAGHEVYGVEPNKSIIERGKEIFGDLGIKHGFVEDADRLFKAKFNNITMVDVLEHINDDRLAFKKSYNLIKEGGRMLVLVPAYPPLFCNRDRMYGHYRRYSKSDLKMKMEEAGFEIEELRFWSALPLLPYALYTRLPMNMEKKYIGMRSGKGFVNKTLTWWFMHVENKVNFGFGVNLLCVGVKP